MANVKIKYYEPIINKPDYQGRIYKKGLMWEGKVHERIGNVKYYSILPLDEESYCIEHNKDIIKQEKQNNFYSNI
jgi:hypothetical protein